MNTDTALEASNSIIDTKTAKSKSGGKGAKAKRQDTRRKFQNDKDDKVKTVKSVDSTPHCFRRIAPCLLHSTWRNPSIIEWNELFL